ncbi:adenine deaminase [Alkaliphilus oremlandii]|uniref:Adenine deaminase n=1 Tax=Alkaliphilus oremlandii (strain OhILAs) TaxID=350688 RepID=A8MLM4_ALKOO|nr:adenine deaminase [Alkaliphilus oremlandii]ABW17941.1 adenine deaminase [Alkaliphilus oremlandii OhILAs]
MKEVIKKRIDIAAGRIKSSLVLKNGKIVNVFSGEIIDGDIAIEEGTIVGIGKYEGLEEIDLKGKYVSPGFIDGHVHIESSMATPSEFAKAIIPRGTTTIIADPHEIANVCGMSGIEYILESSKNIPLNVYVMLPSCVPATTFENSGAILKAEDLKQLIDHESVLGLGELMDYPNVIQGEDGILDKLVMAEGKVIDGHGPVIKDKELNAYVVSGIRTEHECSTAEEMLDRLRLGMYILIREGSAARNLKELIKAVNQDNVGRCLLCADDKHPEDILLNGHIDHNIRLAVEAGISPVNAIRMATLNAAQCYGLKNLGAIAPGYDADIVILEDLQKFKVDAVFKKGNLVAKEHKALFTLTPEDHSKVMDTVNIKSVAEADLKIKLKSNQVHVIRLLPHSLVTKKVVREVEIEDGFFKYSDHTDILKLAVVERHKATGNIGLGFVENFKLKGGAIASTIGHDSHNLIVIGDNDGDIIAAIEEVVKVGGGITIAADGQILKTLELPIAGLMSKEPIEKINGDLGEMLEIAYEKLGVNREIEPFMTLAFLALPVIPDVKLTDMGLFDVQSFQFIDLEA